MQAGFEHVDPFGERVAIVVDLGGHADGALLQVGHGRDQGVHLRGQRHAGALGGLRLFRGAVRPAGDQFRRRFHIAAGGCAIAVQQLRLILHRLPRAGQLPVDPRQPQLQHFRFSAQGAGGVQVAARFGATVAGQDKVAHAQQHDGNQYRRHHARPRGGPSAPLSRNRGGPACKAQPQQAHRRKCQPGSPGSALILRAGLAFRFQVLEDLP